MYSVAIVELLVLLQVSISFLSISQMNQSELVTAQIQSARNKTLFPVFLIHLDAKVIIQLLTEVA